MNRKSREQRWFTLLELLLVASVIILLMSIVLPALRTAREKAKEVQCKDNLKQCGLLTFMYCSDYNDCLPANDNPYSTSYTYWHAYIDNISKICLCPSFAPKKYTSAVFTYGTFHRAGFFKLSTLPQNNKSYSRKLNFCILLADTVAYNSYYDGWYQSYMLYRTVVSVPESGSVHTRHNNKGNCLFPDGRVESENKKQLSSENFKDGCDTYPSVYP